jgi:hypothetical protein
MALRIWGVAALPSPLANLSCCACDNHQSAK